MRFKGALTTQGHGLLIPVNRNQCQGIHPLIPINDFSHSIQPPIRRNVSQAAPSSSPWQRLCPGCQARVTVVIKYGNDLDNAF